MSFCRTENEISSFLQVSQGLSENFRKKKKCLLNNYYKNSCPRLFLQVQNYFYWYFPYLNLLIWFDFILGFLNVGRFTEAVLRIWMHSLLSSDEFNTTSSRITSSHNLAQAVPKPCDLRTTLDSLNYWQSKDLSFT